MIFENKIGTKLNKGILLRRYKRFLADVELDNGEVKTMFVPNTGSMKSCLFPKTTCYFSTTPSDKRKYDSTLQLLSDEDGKTFIGINTHLTNSLVQEFILNDSLNKIITKEEIKLLKPEFKIGKSRFDFYIESVKGERILIEVKNVTMKSDQAATFPDAVSTRGQKHLKELAELKGEYDRCIQFYLIQRENLTSFSFAHDIDPDYFTFAKQAKKAGVEFLAFTCSLSPLKIELKEEIPIQWT
ncbi:DNA/RNA nuclease SfsA [Bacteriovoracaceae bacterium]|nr:DNA/RNA nuclease SfsA [Bacteriovoracaceae bacterium]